MPPGVPGVEVAGDIEGADAATRAFILADFHVCLAEQMGHRLLCDVLRDLTARTTLAATLFQSKHDAKESCAEHAAIVEAMEAGDMPLARERMLSHIGNVETALDVKSAAPPEQAERLRATLAPIARSQAGPQGDVCLDGNSAGWHRICCADGGFGENCLQRLCSKR